MSNRVRLRLKMKNSPGGASLRGRGSGPVWAVPGLRPVTGQGPVKLGPRAQA
jgi:hypothetical protein